MGSLPRSWRAPVSAAALALTLAGCGDDEPAPETRTSVSWQDTDICHLLDADEVAGLIGRGSAHRAVINSHPRRPECVWTVSGAPQRLVLRLWQPPVPARLVETARRSTTVGDHTGYVEREDASTCSMHVEGEPAWLTVALRAPEEHERPGLCDRALSTAETVLGQVR